MPKKAIDLKIDGAWLVPGNGLPPLADAAVAIHEGRILAAASREQIDAEFAAVEQVSLPDHLLAPGLINSHGHLAMNLLRGAAEDLPLQAWLRDHVWPLEGRFVDSSFVRDGVRLAMLEMLRAGVTCFSDMYFFPEVAAREARAAGLRAQIAFPVIDMPNIWSDNAEDGIHKGLALVDEYRHDPHVHIAFGPHSVGTVNTDALSRVLMYSEELDLNIQIHLHENAAEVADNVSQFGVSGIQHLHNLGLLGPSLQAVHVTQISADEIALLQEGNVHVIHCPTSNAKLACGVCPTAELTAAGVNVCLGTDGAASNNRLSVLAEARLASLMAKLKGLDAALLPADQAFDMATLNGARALGLDQDLGSLEVGKWADVIAIDTRAPELQPLYDPLAQLIHSSADTRVSHVWVAGQCLLEEGHATRVDERALMADARAWQQRIAAAN